MGKNIWLPPEKQEPHFNHGPLEIIGDDARADARRALQMLADSIPQSGVTVGGEKWLCEFQYDAIRHLGVQLLGDDFDFEVLI